MPIAPSRVAVDAAAPANLLALNARAVSSGEDVVLRVRIANRTGTASVFLGDTDAVSEATGYEWTAAEGPLELVLEPGEALYGDVVAAGATQTVHVLLMGRP